MNLSAIDNLAIENDECNANVSNVASSTPKSILKHARRHSIACDKNVSFDLGKNELHEFYPDNDETGSNSICEVEVLKKSFETAKINSQGTGHATNDEASCSNFNSRSASMFFALDLSTTGKFGNASSSKNNKDGSAPEAASIDVHRNTKSDNASDSDEAVPEIISLDVHPNSESDDASDSDETVPEITSTDVQRNSDSDNASDSNEAVPEIISIDVRRNRSDSENGERNGSDIETANESNAAFSDETASGTTYVHSNGSETENSERNVIRSGSATERNAASSSSTIGAWTESSSDSSEDEEPVEKVFWTEAE